MGNMDAGTLLRFTGTCRTLMKLGNDHPELFKKFVLEELGRKITMSLSAKNLRTETLSIVKRDPNDPLVRRIAMEKEAEEHAKEEAMKGKIRTKVGPRYIPRPNCIPRAIPFGSRNPRYNWNWHWDDPPTERVVYVDGVARKVKLRPFDPSNERTNFIYGDLKYLTYQPPYYYYYSHS